MEGLKFLRCTIKMPLMQLPVRSTVVDLGAQRLLLSPGSTLTEEDYAGLEGVTDIVANSLFHGDGVARASEHFPEAKVWGVPGVREKYGQVRWDEVLRPATWVYQDELALLPVDGMPRFNEAAFLHRASGALVTADLCFNLTAKGLGSNVVLGLFGTRNVFGVSRLFMRMVRDREAFRASVERLLAEDFGAVVMAHGKLLRGDGNARLREAFERRGVSVRRG